MSRTGFQYALSALSAVAANADFDHGVLRSIHAGLNAAASTGRELSDLEQLALDNLMSHLAPVADEPVVEEPAVEEPASEGEPQGEAGAEGAAPAEPTPGADALFQPQEAEHEAVDEDDGA